MGMESGKRSDGGYGNSFDASVDEGTFGDYEVFGVSSSDDRSSEYEIFIVATPRGLRGPRYVHGCDSRTTDYPFQENIIAQGYIGPHDGPPWSIRQR